MEQLANLASQLPKKPSNNEVKLPSLHSLIHGLSPNLTVSKSSTNVSNTHPKWQNFADFNSAPHTNRNTANASQKPSTRFPLDRESNEFTREQRLGKPASYLSEYHDKHSSPYPSEQHLGPSSTYRPEYQFRKPSTYPSDYQSRMPSTYPSDCEVTKPSTYTTEHPPTKPFSIIQFDPAVSPSGFRAESISESGRLKRSPNTLGLPQMPQSAFEEVKPTLDTTAFKCTVEGCSASKCS
jgi:hypothetical protein